jgi:uncharacterized protein YcbK (DUF882 family)
MMNNHTEKLAEFENKILSRRDFLGGVVAFAGACAVSSPAFASIPKFQASGLVKPARFLAFDNLHTGETTKVTYWEKGSYVKGALAEINHILRDHRNNEVRKIDKKLLDQLFVLQNKLGSRAPFQVISGYRSPASNAKMHELSGGVAKKSMHMEGRAIDIRLQDASLNNVRKAAIAMNAGGVGYYPESKFVHIDTGKIRTWGGA